MKIQPIDIKKIKERKGNPNKMSKDQMEALKLSITTYGELQPVIVDQDNVLIDGHQRLQAYKEMDKIQIPAIVVNLKNEADKKLLSQIMNKLKGRHDRLLDKDEFKAILEDNEFDMQRLTEATAISEQEILNTLNAEESIPRETEGVNNLYKYKVTCPSCGHQFEKKDRMVT